MNEKRVEELLQARGRELDGPVLPAAVEARVRAELAAEVRGEGGRWKPMPVFALTAAAAALVLTLGYLFGTLRQTGGIEVQIAALESTAMIGEHRALHGLDPARLPDLDRGSGSAAPPTEEIVAYAAEAERQAAERALDADVHELESLWFKVAIRPETECSVVLLSVDPRGSVALLYPDAANPEHVPNRFAAGRSHVLPRASVGATQTPSGLAHDYEKGFLRPRSVDHLRVLVGSRADPIDAAFDAALYRFLGQYRLSRPPGSTPEGARAETRTGEMMAWLEDQGFSVQQLIVRGR